MAVGGEGPPDVPSDSVAESVGLDAVEARGVSPGRRELRVWRWRSSAGELQPEVSAGGVIGQGNSPMTPLIFVDDSGEVCGIVAAGEWQSVFRADAGFAAGPKGE